MQGLRIGSTVAASYVYHNTSGGSNGASVTGQVSNITDAYLEIESGGSYQVLPWSNVKHVNVTTP